jgi:hypothetical protein
MSERMKIHLLSLATVVAVALGTAGAVIAAVNTNNMPSRYNENTERPCIPVPGGWTTIDSDNSGANLSGQISENTAFLIQCDADAYLATGTSSAAADSGDGWIQAGSILKLGTDATGRYVSVLNKSDATADCHYVECR